MRAARLMHIVILIGASAATGQDQPAKTMDAPLPSPDDAAAIASTRPMNAWFPAFEPSCHIARLDPGLPLPDGTTQLTALSISRGAEEIAWERRHALGSMMAGVGVSVAATFRSRQAHTLRVFATCDSEFGGPLRCRSRGCFGGSLTLEPDGPTRIKVSIGGQVGASFVGDYFDFSNVCPANARPAALEAGNRPLQLTLPRASLEQCR
jgi:hypothetical protein